MESPVVEDRNSPITELKIPVKLGLCRSCKQLYSEEEETKERLELPSRPPVRERRLVCSAPPTPATDRELIADPFKQKVDTKKHQNESKYVPSFALNNAVRRVNGRKESYLKELGIVS